MKRGNTALKRGVGLASAFALAIAGAVVAAPAASAWNTAAATDITTANSIRAIPAADAALMDSTRPANYAAAFTAGVGTGAVPGISIGATYANARGVQVLLPTLASGAPAWEKGDTVDIKLGVSDGTAAPTTGDVSFSTIPSRITLNAQSYDRTTFAAHAGYVSGTTATAATADTAKLNSTALGTPVLSSSDTVLSIPLPDPAVTGALDTDDTYLLTIDGIALSVSKDFVPTTNLAITASASGTAVDATTKNWTGGGTTTIAYVNKFVVSAKGDTSITNGVVTLPTIYVTEAEKNQFLSAGSTFTLSVSGTDLDSTHAVAFDTSTDRKAVGSGDLSEKVTAGAPAGKDVVVTYAAGASNNAVESIAITGLQVKNVKPGTEVTVSLTAPKGSPANFSTGTTAATTFTATPVQTNGGSVTLKPVSVLPRISGPNRYATAADIAEKLGASNAVIIANGENFKQGVDALSANFLAGRVNAPILLTQAGTLPKETSDELATLFKGSGAAVTVYYMGKTDSVSQAVCDKVEAAIKAVLNPVGSVTAKEIAGDDRYATSAATATTPASSTIGSFDLGNGFLRTAFLASGQVNADALAAGALSAKAGVPVLLTTNGDALPKSVSDAISSLHIGQVVILGNTDRVSQKVEDALAAEGVNVIRKAGVDRYATATLIGSLGTNASPKGFGSMSSVVTAFLASGGDGWPDALTSGPYVGAAATNGVLLTVSNAKTLPSSTASFLKDTDTLTSIVGLGGTDRVTDDAITAAQDAIK